MNHGCSVVHLLDRDFTALCASPYGWLSGAAARCNCVTCLSLLDQAREMTGIGPLVAGDVRIVSH